MIFFSPYAIAESEMTSTAVESYDSTYFGSDWQGEWSAGTYSDGDVVWEDLKIYQSASDSNTDQPSVGSVAETPTWIELGYVNPWRMFDNYVGTDELAKTSKSGSLEVEITTDNIEYVALFNVDADELTIERLDSGDVSQWSVTYNLLDEALAIGDWYEYFYKPYPEIGRDIIAGLDAVLSEVLSEKLKITLTKDSGTVSVSNCFVGYASEVGNTSWEPNVKAYNTGDTSTDTWGRTSFTPGKNYKVISAVVKITNGYENYALRDISALQNSPVVYDFNNNGTEYDILRAYGAVTSIGQILYGPNYSTLDVEIRGIVKKEEV